MEAAHIAVIGGGITGLTAAYELQQRFRRSGRELSLTIWEKSEQLGGAIRTLRRDGFVIEQGPDSFLARKQAALALTAQLGLTDELVGLSPAAAGSYVYLNGRLHPLPAGLAMGIPTQVKPFLGTGLLSVSGKARAALDLLLPRRRTSGDEALGSLLRRRLGPQVVERLVGPVLAGIYAGDLDQLSTAATFPQLLDMERKHRSLILGMTASRRTPQPPGTAGQGLPEQLRRSMFLTYRNGLSTLVDSLVRALEQGGARIHRNSAVLRVARRQDHYDIRLADGGVLRADGVILATPAEQSLRLLHGASVDLLAGLEQIPSVSVANVVFAFDQAQLLQPLQGTGFVIPRQEGLLLTACTWTSVKWAHTAPEGKALIRAYIGHAADQRHVSLADDELVRRALSDLQRIIGAPITPLFSEVARHPEAMPQYGVGHMQRLVAMQRELAARFPHLYAAGRSYRGVGIPDCIAQGQEAAACLCESLRLA